VRAGKKYPETTIDAIDNFPYQEKKKQIIKREIC